MNPNERSDLTAAHLVALRNLPDGLKIITDRLNVKEMGPADHIRTKPYPFRTTYQDSTRLLSPAYFALATSSTTPRVQRFLPMISWIQRYFQHHLRVIFAVLLVIIIVSFVFTIGAAPGIGSGENRSYDRHFFDYNLSHQEDQQRLMNDASLSASLQVGSFGGLQPEQIQNYAFQRAATLHLAKQWRIPAATTAEVTEMIKTLRMFAGQDGQFDPKAYATFRDTLKANPRGATEADIARVIGDDVRAQKVNKLLSGPGYVLPIDVKNQLTQADSSWTLATATTDYTAFAPALQPTDAELTKFFEESIFRYEIQPRLVATYLDFPTINYIGNVTLTESDVRAFYDANPARFAKPAEKPAADATTPVIPKPADPAADYAAARPQVEAALKLERAQRLSVKAASDLALALYEGKVHNEAQQATFLASRQLTPKPLVPFTRESPPVELGGSAALANEAFKMNAERPYSEALPTPTGAVVLFWKETQPARKPLLTEVRDKVSADYLDNEKRKRFVELGKMIKSQLETRLKAGETFEKAAGAVASANNVKLETKTIPAFTLRSRPQDIDYSILGTLERLEKGQVSEMVMAQDKGVFVYAMDKQLPELSETNPRYLETKTQLASYTARMGGSAYVAELVEQELKKSEPKVE